jgi:hypothetical protein
MSGGNAHDRKKFEDAVEREVQRRLKTTSQSADTDLSREKDEELKPRRNQRPSPKKRNARSMLVWLRGAAIASFKYIVFALTFLATLVTLYPRVTITVAGPSDDKNPLSASFTVSNDGYLPARTIVAQCTLKNLKMGNPNTGNSSSQQSGESTPVGNQWKVEELAPGEKMGIPISNCFIVPYESLTDANVGLLVTYRPDFLPEQQTTSVFQVKNIGAGHFYWYSSPRY